MRNGASRKKLHIVRSLAAALLVVFLVGSLGTTVMADGSVGTYQGFDDYLNNTSGTDYFGHEINLEQAEVDQAEKKLKLLNDLISVTKRAGTGYNANAKIELADAQRLTTVDESKGLFGSKKYSVTIYSQAFGGGFITIKVDEWMSSKAFQAVTLARDNLEKYVKEHQNRADGLRTIYRGFAVIGNVKGNNAPQGKSFAVGSLSGGTILDRFMDRAKDNLYGSGEYDRAVEDESEPGKFEKAIAEPIGNGAFNLYLWMSNWNVDLTMDGLIFGRLSPLYKGNVDFTHFGLEENNPYGIVAAAAYYVLRRIMLGVLPVIFMAMLLRQLFNNGQKGRAALKAAAGNFLLAIVLAFVAPYLIEICITLRDGVLKYVSLGMGNILKAAGLGDGVGGNMVGLVYVMFRRNPTLLNALVWASSVGAGFIYFTSYVQIAVFLTGCVAVLPVVLFISIWNPKIIKDWWNVFFPNLCVPLVDLILLQIPSVILILFKSRLGGNGGSLVLGILIIVIMWNSLMIRDRVIRLLGFEGFTRRTGGMIAAAAMMIGRAARSVQSIGHSHGGGAGGDKQGQIEGNMEGDRQINSERGKLQDEALKGIGGSSVPGEDEKNYDPNLGNSTEDYLNGLDEKYGEGGAGFPEPEPAEGELANPEPAQEGEETPVGLPEGEGGEGNIEPEVPEGEMPEGGSDGIPTGEIPEGEGGMGGEVPVGAEGELPEGGGIPGGGISGEVPGSDGIAAMDGGEAAGVRSIAEGVPGDPKVSAPADNAVERGAITGRAEDFMQNPKYPSREPVTDNIDRELAKAYNPVERTKGDGTKELDHGRYGDLVNGEFRKNELSTDAEKGRYDNLVRMDAYNAKIKENEAAMKSAGYSRDTYEKERASFMGQEKELNSHINASRDRLNAMTDQNSDAYRAEKAAYEEMRQKKSLVHDRVEQLDRAAGLDRANAQYKEEIGRMAQTENSYAKAWKVGGMSDRTYQTAKDYEYQTRLDGAHRKLATYKDFDSKRYEGILTPAEKENFYREREVHERRERTVRALSAAGSYVADKAVWAASVGVGATGAVLTAYGGGKTMADFTMLGGKLTRMGGDFVTEKAGTVGRFIGNRYVNAPVSAPRETSSGSQGAGSANGGRRETAQRGGNETNPSDPKIMGERAKGAERPERPRKVQVSRGSGSSDPKVMGERAGAGSKGGRQSGERRGSGSSDPRYMGNLANEGNGREKGGEGRRTGEGGSSPKVMGERTNDAGKGRKTGEGNSDPGLMGNRADKGSGDNGKS